MWENPVPIKIHRGWFIISLEMPQGWSWSTWWWNMNKNLLWISILVQILRHCRLSTLGFHVLCDAHVGDSQTLSFTCKCRPPFTANFHKDHVSLIMCQAWHWPLNHFKTKARPKGGLQGGLQGRLQGVASKGSFKGGLKGSLRGRLRVGYA